VPANATQLNEEQVWNSLCVSDKSEIKGKAKDIQSGTPNFLISSSSWIHFHEFSVGLSVVNAN